MPRGRPRLNRDVIVPEAVLAQSSDTVLIEATVPADLFLGDNRVIYGDGDGVHGEFSLMGGFHERPLQAWVGTEVANDLIGQGKAKLA